MMVSEESSLTSAGKQELEKAYDAKKIDAKWYRFWEDSGYFHADVNSDKEPFVISIPPPNITGVLHMGHALVNTLQDTLIRWKRMQGYEALWIPGTDHAGISTQTVVEKHLIQTVGKSRKEFQREEFLAHVFNWKDENQKLILSQLKKVGCSCDWQRLRFTMDEGCNKAVRQAFKRLFDEGLIYRGDYLVNWDPVTQTALADDEVEYEERKSFLWVFKYPFSDGSGYIKIATTRPETMLGDTAVAVSPSDTRYAHLIGKALTLPLMNREIPIIADYQVDPDFGTGAVKVTPAHDPNDYQMGMTHNLSFINIMTPDGNINDNGGQFAGMSMVEARKAVVAAMEQLNLVERIDPHLLRVGVSYRSKAVIEPYLSKQWFVKMKHFGLKMRAAVQEGRVKLVPQNWENTYYHWIDNLRDWCISRQLWWGHRIPVWYNKSNPDHVICYAGEGLPPEVEKAPDEWMQDEDVLDTWFSSALWPASILGWPEDTPDLRRFYPNSTLVTGHDILFFWVARMILMGEYVMDKVPFSEVYIHGLIYGKSYWRQIQGGSIEYIKGKERLDYELGAPQPKDVHFKWEKMSKTKGNVIDPIEIIEQYGTDAMRMALCASATQTREIDLDRRRFEEYKNFANKIWNGARFVFMNLDPDNNLSSLTALEFSSGLKEEIFTLEDHWILSELNHTIKEVNQKLTSYNFDQAAKIAYDFFWNYFCSYYLEIAKPVLFGKAGSEEERKNKQKMLVIILCQAVRLIHPMAPFISEEIFQQLKSRFPTLPINGGEIACDVYTKEAIKALNATACIIAPYPEVIRESDLNPSIERTFDLVGKVVWALRNLRAEMKVSPSTITDLYIVEDNENGKCKILKENANILTALVKINELFFHTNDPVLPHAAYANVEGLKIFVPLPPELLVKEQERLKKEIERLTVNIEKSRTQLSNKEFVEKAPQQLVSKLKSQLDQFEKEMEDLQRKLQNT